MFANGKYGPNGCNPPRKTTTTPVCMNPQCSGDAVWRDKNVPCTCSLALKTFCKAGEKCVGEASCLPVDDGTDDGKGQQSSKDGGSAQQSSKDGGSAQQQDDVEINDATDGSDAGGILAIVLTLCGVLAVAVVAGIFIYKRKPFHGKKENAESKSPPPISVDNITLEMEMKVDDSSENSDWRTHEDDEGNVYYEDVKQGRVTWTDPAQSPRNSNSDSKWEELKDPSGTSYYYNRETQRTTWSSPKN